jgi:hypothetical protein
MTAPAENQPVPQPGAGCRIVEPHRHWCGFCGAEMLFGRTQCQRLAGTPPCDRCSELAWRTDPDPVVHIRLEG